MSLSLNLRWYFSSLSSCHLSESDCHRISPQFYWKYKQIKNWIKVNTKWKFNSARRLTSWLYSVHVWLSHRIEGRSLWIERHFCHHRAPRNQICHRPHRPSPDWNRMKIFGLLKKTMLAMNKTNLIVLAGLASFSLIGFCSARHIICYVFVYID